MPKLILILMFLFPFSVLGSPNNNEVCSYFSDLSDIEIEEIIKNDGFSGVIDQAVSLQYLGCYVSGNYRTGYFFYEREFGNKRVTKRLIILGYGKKYLGMYSVPEKPVEIIGPYVKFNFPKEEGNNIFIHNGELPESVYLDGENFSLFK